MVEPYNNRGLHYRIHRIMVDIAFLQEFLHIRIVKFLSSVSIQIFRSSCIVSNYFCDHLCHLVPAFGFEQFSLCMLTQHVDNDENVVITSESRIWVHLDYICLSQVISVYCDVFAENFFSPECAIHQLADISQTLRIIIQHDVLLESSFQVRFSSFIISGKWSPRALC